MNNDYINLARKKIFDLGMNNQNLEINQLNEQDLESFLINRAIDQRSISIKGKYQMDSHGNEIPLSVQITGNMLSREGYPVETIKELHFTQSDGTSTGEFVECMNCGETVHKSNVHRCICGKTCCVLCGKLSKLGKYYCSTLHKLIGEGIR